MGTGFQVVYNRFLGKITDDMYMELTPQDTVKDLQRLLINAIQDFEFPRVDLEDYEIKILRMHESQVTENDFIIGIADEELDSDGELDGRGLLVERSMFHNNLTSEEVNILAILMMIGWLQRQVTSIENTRMKYSGADFKMTSQANHLAKLLSALTECQRQSHHMQRLYKRRRPSTAADLDPVTGKTTGPFASNWDVFRYGVYNKNEKAVAASQSSCDDGELIVIDSDKNIDVVSGGNAANALDP